MNKSFFLVSLVWVQVRLLSKFLSVRSAAATASGLGMERYNAYATETHDGTLSIDLLDPLACGKRNNFQREVDICADDTASVLSVI